MDKIDSITVAARVGLTLTQLGVGRVFGVAGSGNFEVTETLRAAGVPFVATRHEGGAATMADAFSRMSGALGVVSVHQGCGLTNAITGIGEAAKSRTPLLVLAAEATGAAVNSNFAMDQDALIRSVGAESHRVHSAQSAVADTIRAYRAAVNGSRTVVLNLPLDVQSTRSIEPADSVVAPLPPLSQPRPAQADVEALAQLIHESRRPVFLAGRGARSAGTVLRELAAATGALLATSAVAKGLWEDDPFSVGISGGFSSPTTAELIRGADLIVGFGCSFTMWTTRHGALIGPETTLAQVDRDEAALGARRAIGLGVVGDSAETARALLDAVGAASERPERYRTAEVRERIERSCRWQDTPIIEIMEPGRIDARVLSRRLDDLLPRERVVAVDSGNFMGYPSQYLDVPDENGFCFTQSFQSIGLGLATALGAALAQPARLPVLGAGDGGFLMGIAELETAVRLRIPLVCVVYNDAAYGAEVHHFALTGHNTTIAEFPETDIAAIARGFGATGITVRGIDDLDAVATWLASEPTAPLVIDAKIASDGGAWWLVEAFVGH